MSPPNFLSIGIILIIFFSQVGSQTCPNDCTVRGICTFESACLCDSSYAGPDCSKIKCPYDKAWTGKAYSFNHAHDTAECSNNGVCDYSVGACKCYPGYEGAACQRLSCNCNGNGLCMTTNRLYDAYTIVKPSNNALDTYSSWDAEHTSMCVCDYGYMGSNCEMRLCPKGTDPLQTYTDFRSIVITTSASSCSNGEQFCTLTGSYELIFNGQSFVFPADATAWSSTACQTAFESLPNIGQVKCTQGTIAEFHGTTYAVHFLSWPTFPYENNVYNHLGYPPLSSFQCTTTAVTATGGAVNPSCTIADVTINTYPGE